MASPSSSTLVSSSALNSALTWDAFLSYRGPDTGPKFTAHLYAALDRHRIKTYKDDYKLRQGEVITQALKKAIKASKIYIVVFSKDYASSPWCLDELVDIVSFHEKEERLIIPVFYHIDPSVVRHVGIEKEEKESSIYDKALQLHAKGYYKNEELRVKSWLYALKVAANISGNHICEKNREEPDVLEKIVAEILPRINPKSFDEKTVGLEPRINSIVAMLSSRRSTGVTKIGIHGMGGVGKTVAMLSSRRSTGFTKIGRHGMVGVGKTVAMLSRRSTGVTKIGIHGMGGVGKTTLAKAVFDKIHLRFTGSCFLGNVMANSGTDEGMKSLQQQLLDDVLLQNEKDVKDVARGKKLIETKLANQKILVVIDDVSCYDQLESFGAKSFAHGSVVIITTRQEDILKYFGVKTEHRYLVNKLDREESLTLFQQHAFRFGTNPDNALMELSNDILSLADGLPLALKVFGSFLCTKYEVKEWIEFIEKLKKTPNKEIQDSLLISFNAIDDDPQVKKMFLDIACFFVGWPKKRVFEILETYYSNVDVKINNLKGRCLLSINDRNVFHMHDLLRDMGREVARNDSPDEPERYSRLWIPEVIQNVLSEEDEEIKAIEGIFYSGEKEASMEVPLSTKTFRKMKKLRFLHLRGFKNLTGSFYQTFKDLRWLYWDSCPLECLPSEFKPLKLRILELPQSIMRTLELNMVLQSLKTLDMRHSLYLAKTPDFNMLPSLVSLNLAGCESLKEVHGSIGRLAELVSLNMNGCVKLVSLPGTIGLLKALEFLDVSNCSSLVELPTELGNITSLRVLSMMATSVSNLPDSIGCLTNLVQLILCSNYNLKTLPDTICNLRSLEILNIQSCRKLEKLPGQMSMLTSLKKLVLWDTEMLKIELSQIPSSPEMFDMSWNVFTALASGISQLTNLEYLNVEGCSQLLSSEELPPNLKELNASRCTSMKRFQILANLERVERLIFQCCVRMEETYGLERRTSVTQVEFAWCIDLLFVKLPPDLKLLIAYQFMSLKSLPNLSNLKHLEMLNRTECTSSTMMIQGLDELTFLKILDLHGSIQLLSIGEIPSDIKWMMANGCKSIERPPNLFTLKHLEHLSLKGCGGVTEIQGLDELASLRQLDLEWCIHLLSVGELPSTIIRITMSGCISLERLPNLSNLKHLQYLSLEDCDGLAEIQGLEELISFRQLNFYWCVNLLSIGKLPPNLECITAIGCLSLKRLPNLSNMKHLKQVSITACPDLVEI